MQYAVSDIHGNFEAYESILNVIGLKNTDILYVLGDVIDYGDDGIKILQDMMMHGNIIPILGEHEFIAYKIMRLMKKSPEQCMNNPKSKKLAELWMKRGGEKTLSAFMALDDEAKTDILEFLEEFSTYEEVEVGGRTFVLIHGGFTEFDISKPLDDYKISELLTGVINPEKEYYHNKYIVAGHTSTDMFDGESRGRVLISGKNILIDCGCNGNSSIGCYCLDNGEVFYSDVK